MRTTVIAALGFLVFATAVQAQPRGEALVYERAGFAGRSVALRDDMGNLELVGFNNRASSLYVIEGTWEFCTDAWFRGSCRLYGPGQAHWGSAKFTSACTLGGSKQFQTWFQAAAKGQGIRKNITVTLFKSDKTPGRSYTLNECFPTQWSSVNFDTSSTVQTETITVNVGYIKFST